MGVLADEYIRLRPDVSRMSREVRKAGADAGRTFGGSFSGAAKKLIATGLIFKGLQTVTRFLADANAEARESNKVNKQTVAGIKSTGGAAKISASQISALSTAISNKTGIDDEAVQSGANLLLTFTKVRNEVGKGNDIFSQATQVVQDMSVKFKQDGRSSAIQLGKALQDPVKGMGSLARVGVQFTDQQKEQIKTLVKSGDILGAQKIILGELRTQTQGAAEANADWADKAKVAYANVKETVGNFLRKGLEPVSKWFVEIGLPAVQDFFKKISTDKDLKAALTDLKDALTALTGKDFKASLDGLAASLPPVVTAISDAITKYKEFSDVVDKFENKSFAEGDKRGGPVGQIVKDFKAGGTIEQALIQFRGFMVRHIKQGWADVKAAFIEDSSQVVGIVGRFVGGVVRWFAALPGRVMVWVRRLWADAKASFIKNHSQILADVGRFLSRMLAFFAGWFTTLKTRWSTFWTGIKKTGSDAMDSVRTKITTVLDKIKTAFSTAKTSIKKIWDGVKSVVSTPIIWIKDNVYNKPLVPVWNRVAKLVSGPTLSTYASGGVEGVRPGYTPGRDTHLIGVGGGEAIMRPEWTRAVGKGWVDQANDAARKGVGRARQFMGFEGFQGGGVVGWLKSLTSSATGKVGDLAGKLKSWVLGGLHALAAKILNPIKGVIGSAMPNTGVGTTVGNIGKKAIDLVLDKIKSSDAAAVTAQGGYTGPPGTGSRRIVNWRGGRFTERFRNTLGQAQSMTRAFIRVIQGGFSRSVAASGTSHYGDAIDTVWNASILTALRRAGVAAWHRTPAQGFSHHIHGVPLPGRGYPGGSGIWQAQDYLRGGNGLALGGIVKGGRGGMITTIGEGRHDELVTPLPKNWSGGTSRPITIILDLGDGLVQKIQGVVDDNDQFKASMARAR